MTNQEVYAAIENLIGSKEEVSVLFLYEKLPTIHVNSVVVFAILKEMPEGKDFIRILELTPCDPFGFAHRTNLCRDKFLRAGDVLAAAKKWLRV